MDSGQEDIPGKDLCLESEIFSLEMTPVCNFFNPLHKRTGELFPAGPPSSF